MPGKVVSDMVEDKESEDVSRVLDVQELSEEIDDEESEELEMVEILTEPQ